MAVAFRSAGTLVGSTTTVTPGLPAGYAANDIFLLVVASQQSEPASAPSGYAAVTSGAQDATGPNGQYLSTFWKRAAASETAPTVADTGNHAIAQIFAFSGCVTTGDPWDATAGNSVSTASTTVTWPSVTTTVANTMIVNVLARGGDSAAAYSTGETNSNLTNLTERADSGDLSGSGGGIIVLTGEWASTGACGATTSTVTSCKQARCTIALKPSTGGASGVGATDGTSTATAVGAAQFNAVAATAGEAIATAVAGGNLDGVGAAAGEATASAVSILTYAGAGASAGIATAAFVSGLAGNGAAAGIAAVSGVGKALFKGIATTAGATTVSGVGDRTALEWLAQAFGTSTGVFVGAANIEAVAEAAASASGDWPSDFDRLAIWEEEAGVSETWTPASTNSETWTEQTPASTAWS